MNRRAGSTAFQGSIWIGSVVLGAVVLIVVFGLRLYPRLDGGQSVLDAVRPAYTDAQVAGTKSGIGAISDIVDLSDPVMTDQQSGAAEVQKLIAVIAQTTHLAPAEVVATLESKFPHVAGLLEAAPLSSVAGEEPQLLAFLGQTLGITPAQLEHALAANFPHLAQSLSKLPIVAGAWNAVPGIGEMTRFDGSPVRTVPQARGYFREDLVGTVIVGQQANDKELDGIWPPVSWFPVVLTLLGVGLIALGITVRVAGGGSAAPAALRVRAWGALALIGVVVLVIVFGLRLYPRLGSGNELVNAVSPAFTDTRVTGARAAATLVSDGVDLLDPIVTQNGGAANEVPILLHLVASSAAITDAQAAAALHQRFPHTAGLLAAIPLSSVTAELPPAKQFLGSVLHLSPTALQTTLQQQFPRLAQALAALPKLTGEWASVPDTMGMTRFDGSAVRTVPQVRSYFANDLVTVLEQQKDNVGQLANWWPPLNWLPPVLTSLGIVLIAYGGLGLRGARLAQWLRRRRAPPRRHTS